MPRSSTSATSSGGIRTVSPTLALAVFGGAAPANLGIALGVHGPILSTANSCASGAVAIGEARGRDPGRRDRRRDRRRRRGPAQSARVRCVRHHPRPVAGLERQAGPCGAAVRCRSRRVRHGRGCRPARPRGPPIRARRPWRDRPYAEVMGYGASSDAHHMVQPRPDGVDAARAARIALDDAGSAADEIDYVNAHASSTPIGDVAEARAIAMALGDRAATVPVSGTKALYGHPLGASGAIEAAICALTIRDGWAPASVNLEGTDPDAARCCPGLLRAGRAGTYRRVLSTSFGFGGLNAALVFGAVDGDRSVRSAHNRIRLRGAPNALRVWRGHRPAEPDPAHTGVGSRPTSTRRRSRPGAAVFRSSRRSGPA